MSRILLAGEQVTAVSVQVKGFDCFNANAYVEDGSALAAALSQGNELTWMKTQAVPSQFPETMAALRAYDVVVISDVGSNSLLFHPEMLAKSLRHPNRLTLLRDYVAGGGGLVMIGGWMSFAGVDGKARFHSTPLEEALPVTCLPYDDRQERPEGVIPAVALPAHPVLAGLPGTWPYFLGYNQVKPRPQAQVLVKVDNDPLLAVWQFGKGRAAAFTSDAAPHWGPPDFLNWPGYVPLWKNLSAWLAGK
jgi:uncharacterized membrane protein